MSRRKRYTRNLGRKLAEPQPLTDEWVRFEHATEPFGVFTYVDDACARLPRRSIAEVARLMAWFGRHLAAPAGHIDLGQARFWFRAEAAEYLGRCRQLADLVSRAGIPIVERRTTVLRGSVRWQDQQQMAVLLTTDEIAAPRPAAEEKGQDLRPHVIA